jgi:hypothetical protein
MRSRKSESTASSTAMVNGSIAIGSPTKPSSFTIRDTESLVAGTIVHGGGLVAPPA